MSFQHKNMLLQQWNTKSSLSFLHEYGDPRKQNEWYFATQKPELKAQGWKKRGGMWNSGCSFYFGVEGKRRIEKCFHKGNHPFTTASHTRVTKDGIFAVLSKQLGYKNDALHSTLKQQTCNLGSVFGCNIITSGTNGHGLLSLFLMAVYSTHFSSSGSLCIQIRPHTEKNNTCQKIYTANICCRLKFYTTVISLICLTFNKRWLASFSVLSSLCFLSGFSDALPSATPPVSFNRFSIPLCGGSSSTLNWNRQIQQLRWTVVEFSALLSSPLSICVSAKE